MTFSHLQRSTLESAWVEAGVRNLPRLSAASSAHGTVVVLLAHPDDEALGCPGLLRYLDRAAASVAVVLFTAGEKSHPDSSTHTPEQLAAVRLAEFETALTGLNSGAVTTVLHYGDGELHQNANRILAEVDAMAEGLPTPLTIVAPYGDDGHSDHETLGNVAREVGRRRRAAVLEFPIWYWHWAAPDDRAWRSWEFLPDPEGLDREALWEGYPSQTQPLSDLPGDEALLQPEVLAHFSRGGDTFAVTRFDTEPGSTNDASTAEEVFDQVHVARTDPWNLRSSKYEIAKRAALVQALPKREYAHILEIGCSIGALSAELAQRGNRTTAVDVSEQALATARTLYPRVPGLQFERVTIPYEWPSGIFDCVVLAETGYYLTPGQLLHTLIRIEASTTPDFTLVLCHWTGAIDDWPLDADQVHEACREFWPDASLVHHRSAEYRLDVLVNRAEPSPSSSRTNSD